MYLWRKFYRIVLLHFYSRQTPKLYLLKKEKKKVSFAFRNWQNYCRKSILTKMTNVFGKDILRNNGLRNRRRTGSSRILRVVSKKRKIDTAARIAPETSLAKILIASVAVLHNFVMHPVKRNTIVSFARRENARGCFAPHSVHRLRLRKPDRLELSAKFM